MDNLKLLNPSNLDQYQMDNRTFDADKDAWRVSIVDGIKVENLNLTGEFGSKVEVIKVPEIITKTEVKEISVPTIITQNEVRVERVEVPVIVKEYVNVEVPVVVKELQIVEIERPIYLKQTEFKEIPTIIKACIILQALATMGMLITHILKG